MVIESHRSESMKTKTRTRGESVQQDAPRHLADHVLTERSKPGDYARVWHVGKPGTSDFHYKIVTWPGYLSIYGDIGGQDEL
jgi:hypothetical protein